MKISLGLRFLLIGESIVMFAAAMLAPIMAIFIEKIGGTILDAGYTVALFSFASAITTYVAGLYASDRLKHPQSMIMIGYGIMGFGFMAMTQVDSVAKLLVVQFCIGIASPMYAPAFNALYSRNINPKRAGYEWGLWDVTNYSMMGFGALIGGIVAHYLGFNALFIAMGMLCWVSALYIRYVQFPNHDG